MMLVATYYGSIIGGSLGWQHREIITIFCNNDVQCGCSLRHDAGGRWETTLSFENSLHLLILVLYSFWGLPPDPLLQRSHLYSDPLSENPGSATAWPDHLCLISGLGTI